MTLGLYCIEHVVEVPVPNRKQDELVNVPVLLVVKVTKHSAHPNTPVDVSVTVAEQVTATPTSSVEGQLTIVVVVLLFTVTVVLPELPAWIGSSG